MRGKVSTDGLYPTFARITPAYAGKRLWETPLLCRNGDHPRACGEKLGVGAARIGCGGITPAYAGKSSRNETCWHRPWDHPRVCGEKIAIRQSAINARGSPPRMRGKDALPRPLPQKQGITPACAGKSGGLPCRVHRRGDHPRVCGEKFHPASDRKLGRVRDTKRSSGPAPAAAPAGLAGSCPASPPWSYPPRITVSRPRP